MEKEETQNHIERSSLWTDIFTIVKQLPRRNVEGDAPDAFSISTDIEMLIAAREARLVEALGLAIEEMPRKVWGDTARGKGIGGQMMTSEGEMEYANRLHELARLLTKALADINPNGDEKSLDDQIASGTKSWEGVDTDKFTDEMRGR